jgi:hypothetical protein
VFLMKWDNDYNPQPGPWGGRGEDIGLERDIEEYAAHYAEALYRGYRLV